MYIANVHIENFRNFSKIDVPLKPFTIIVGKNDMGKSNLVDAMNILLYNSKAIIMLSLCQNMILILSASMILFLK